MRNCLRFLVLCLLCVCLNACTNTKKELGYSLVIGAETTSHGYIVQDQMIIAEYQNEKRALGQAYLNAHIRFPQITNMRDSSVEEKVNRILKDVAVETVSYLDTDETLKMFSDIVNGNLPSQVWGGDNEYKIIFLNDEIISVNFFGDCYFGGAHPSFTSQHVTISLANGEKVPYTDYFSKDSMINAIKAKNFEWIEGQYTGGYKGNEPELITKFVSTFSEGTQDNIVYDKYRPSYKYSFAIDEEFVYLNMYFYDSLHGFVVLKFRLSDLD